MILLGKKKSIQNNLNNFFDKVGEIELIPSSSAYTQARNKLKPEAFIEINNKIISSYYKLYEYKKWNNKRLIGIDGSFLNLPTSEEIKGIYNIKRNKDSELPACLSSFAYDVLNDMTINATFGVIQGEKEFIINEQIGRAHV